MGTRSPYDLRYLVAGVLAAVLVLAAGIPLYLSGTPKLSAGSGGTPTVSAIAANPTPIIAPSVAATTTTGTAQPTARSGEMATPRATAVSQPVENDPQLAAAVQTVIDGQPGVFGIVIAGAGEAPAYSLNADVPFEAASLYKLVLIADVYGRIEQGTISADADLPILPEYYPAADEPVDSYFDPASSPDSVPVSEALFAAGAYSSNVAARALLSLTDEASLRTTAVSLGMTESYFFVDPRDLDGWPPTALPGVDDKTLSDAVAFAEREADSGPIMLTTPRDMALYFQKLHAGEVIDPTVSAKILDILKQQAVDDRFPCLLPDGTQLAHKTGNLDHVVHDVGIIWNGDQPIVAVVMIEDPDDDGAASALIQRLALVAYDKDDDPQAAADAEANPNCGVDEVADPTEAPVDEFVPEDEVTTDQEPPPADDSGV